MPFASSHGTGIYYERHGPKPGAAPAIVFVHGAGGNHLSWWQQLPHFTDRYSCIAYDQRGYGQSRDSDGGPGGAAFVNDLCAVMDDAGVERATLVAQSLGGWACLGFTRRWPQRVERLVMCDTHGGLESPELRSLWTSTLALAAALPDGVHPACGERMFREQPDVHFLYVAISELNARSHREMLEDIRSAGPMPLAEAVHIDTPVLFIEGADDIVILPSMIKIAAVAFPRARLEVVPRAGHSVYFERPAEFNAILDRE